MVCHKPVCSTQCKRQKKQPDIVKRSKHLIVSKQEFAISKQATLSCKWVRLRGWYHKMQLTLRSGQNGYLTLGSLLPRLLSKQRGPALHCGKLTPSFHSSLIKRLWHLPFSFPLPLLPSFLWCAPAKPCNSHNYFWEAERRKDTSHFSTLQTLPSAPHLALLRGSPPP